MFEVSEEMLFGISNDGTSNVPLEVSPSGSRVRPDTTVGNDENSGGVDESLNVAKIDKCPDDRKNK